MKVAVAGAGKVGQYVAADLVQRGHEVLIVEQNKDIITRLSGSIPCTWVHADACEPFELKGIGLDTCDVMVAATGDDEDNLVISLLAKQEYAIPRVLARVNHPKNHWLFNESWGVDAAVSPPHLLTALVEEAVSVGDLVRLLTLEKGKVSLVEVTLSERSFAAGRLIGELGLPQDCAVVAVVRNQHVIVPRDETPLIAGDEVLALAVTEAEAAIEELLSGERPPEADAAPGLRAEPWVAGTPGSRARS
ncbi:MAG TPA: TrkA family potassium uptake protein [Actinomycetota bacterium]|nr:TrkA family potassium uptake protein [Actinomycetota bacterium]